MTLSRRETRGRQTMATIVAMLWGGPAISTFGPVTLLPAHPPLLSCALRVDPALPVPLQGGAGRAAAASSRWAGEFGHGGPSGRGLCEAQGSVQSLHWRGPETGQVRAARAEVGHAGHCAGSPDPVCRHRAHSSLPSLSTACFIFTGGKVRTM